jgi:2,3-bisphosphoglycerate-independent phosphoglycerate mutase
MFKLPLFISKHTIRPVVLVVLDGFGLAPPSPGNAISIAKMPYMQKIFKEYPHTELIASGESVGLPANEVGNTEVGHLTIGAGRVILQDLKRINESIEKGTFYENTAFGMAALHTRKNSSKLHILCLLSSGKVHASKEHLYALLQYCKKEQLTNVCIHIFTDGRDAPPKEGIRDVEELEQQLALLRVGRIVSVSGRYYAMDRDRRWPRIEKVYRAITQGIGIQTLSAKEAVESAYARGQTDEFIEPTLIVEKGKGPITIDDNDAVIFANYRIDRAKELSMSLVLPNFENLAQFDFGYDPSTNLKVGEVSVGTTFIRGKTPQNLCFVTMTEYQKQLPVSAVAFAPAEVANSFSQIISASNMKQIHLSESEKERFVTYYFDGMREQKSVGEDTVIIPSPKVPTYDKKPEMSLPKLVNECLHQLSKDVYHFMVVNFANADMLGHTGNITATVAALEHIDKHISRLTSEVLRRDGALFITADHGNSEEMLTFPSSAFFYTTQKGILNTDHSNNPVPFIAVHTSFKGKTTLLSNGGLSDVSPTILDFMGIEKPKEMTGHSLLTKL